MSAISNKIRAYVNDYSVSDHYGIWGILRPDQRKTIRKLCDTCDMFEKTADNLFVENKRLKEEIKLLTADVVEVKHGEWIKRYDKFSYWYECSECSERTPYNQYKQISYSKYCPNCGAKMDGGKTE